MSQWRTNRRTGFKFRATPSRDEEVERVLNRQGFHYDVRDVALSDLKDIEIVGADLEFEDRRVHSLRDDIAAGAKVPRIVVTRDGHVLDGAHRIRAYQLLGATRVPAIVIDIDYPFSEFTPRYNELARVIFK